MHEDHRTPKYPDNSTEGETRMLTITPETSTRLHDPTLVELVDSLVQAVDANRADAIDRLREALEPLGATGLFNDELRLNGWPSNSCELCTIEGWL